MKIDKKFIINKSYKKIVNVGSKQTIWEEISLSEKLSLILTSR